MENPDREDSSTTKKLNRSSCEPPGGLSRVTTWRIQNDLPVTVFCYRLGVFDSFPLFRQPTPPVARPVR
jgi:hypothetical protein